MEQIEQICIEARAHGMTYGEYIEKCQPNLPKPTPTKYKEYDWWEGTNRKPPRIRKEREIVCETCGKPFISKSPTARNCEECRTARKLELMREWRAKKAKERKPKEKNCAECGVLFTPNTRAIYCPVCAKSRRKQQLKEGLERFRDKKKAEKANAKIQE
jgi:Zn finger protein HypA/HybF involved in hydrogenase expression